MSNFPRKPEPRSGPVELPHVITPPEVTFVGEQTGPAENEMKDRLRRLFALTPQIVRRAYLARVSFGEQSAVSVVLCVRHIASIEETLQKGFKHMFSEILRRGNFYDWLILGEEHERELRKVCEPFYDAV